MDGNVMRKKYKVKIALNLNDIPTIEFIHQLGDTEDKTGCIALYSL